MLREIKESFFDELGDRVKTQCLQGDIAGEILDYAKRECADLIVMGSRGLGAFSKTLLGSVSNKIANRGDISVLIVK